MGTSSVCTDSHLLKRGRREKATAGLWVALRIVVLLNRPVIADRNSVLQSVQSSQLVDGLHSVLSSFAVACSRGDDGLHGRVQASNWRGSVASNGLRPTSKACRFQRFQVCNSRLFDPGGRQFVIGMSHAGFGATTPAWKDIATAPPQACAFACFGFTGAFQQKARNRTSWFGRVMLMTVQLSTPATISKALAVDTPRDIPGI